MLPPPVHTKLCRYKHNFPKECRGYPPLRITWGIFPQKNQNKIMRANKARMPAKERPAPHYRESEQNDP
ncbi:conserved domain protein [Ruminococcus albus 8]|uniref:Conserved domain protein n=1 Tax=Ruminococcus albus 8 TaxID=246199 RepID=E9SBE0_RUMAL|nr:conserved domain protein [Ruminococcus albus 8]